jgi:hypothetical protein
MFSFKKPREFSALEALSLVCHSGLDPESGVSDLDSRSPPSRGQVYPCESRGGNDNSGIIVRQRWTHYTKCFSVQKR